MASCLLSFCATDNPLYTDTRYNNNISYNDNLIVTKSSLAKEVTIRHKSCKNIVYNTLKKRMFWIIARIASVRRF